MAEKDSTDHDASASKKKLRAKEVVKEVALILATANPHAQAMAHARAAKLSPQRRSEIARTAATARWKKKK